MPAPHPLSCDFYSRDQWNEAAVHMAELVQRHVFDRHFGVCPWVVERFFVFFANEGQEHRGPLLETVRQEIDTITGMKELGAGASEDGDSWAIIVDAENVLADGTDDVCEMMQNAITRAWRIARGFLDDEPGRG